MERGATRYTERGYTEGVLRASAGKRKIRGTAHHRIIRKRRCDCHCELGPFVNSVRLQTDDHDSEFTVAASGPKKEKTSLLMAIFI